jgi:histidinol phosphatase-like PHP family hydrolase
MIIDLHVHTARGSADSGLTTEEMIEEANRVGLEGICLTEHGAPWDQREFDAFRQDNDGLFFFNGMEVETTVGHITVFGLDKYVGGIHDPLTLRRVADAQGAFIVLAHPFRYLLQQPAYNLLFRGSKDIPQTVGEALEHPIFEVVDALEVSNGGTSPAENDFALQVARYLGKPTVGGSDAHSTNGLGRSVTVFRDRISSAAMFMEALHESRFYAAVRTAEGALLPMD